jgi:peptide/nickel transport system ATP-binding protein
MLLEVRDLIVALGSAQPVNGLTFSLDRGQRLGLVGDSGSGKSLVGLAIAGLLPPGATVTGTVTLDGTPLPTTLADLTRLRATRLAIVRQGDVPAFDPARTLRQLVPDEAMLAELQLAPDRFASSLTPAERQVLHLAQAVTRKPDLLILDEPFVILDAPTQKRLIEFLSRQPMGMLVIGHDLAGVAALCADVMIIEAGKLVESGPSAEIFSRPRQDYSKRLIAGGRIRARTLMRSPIGTDLLEVQGVSMVYRDKDRIFRGNPPVVALDAVSFALRRGEALAVVGAAGSGKTSLARLIAGLGRTTRGILAYERQAYRGADLPRALRQEISLVFADPRLAFSPRITLGASVAEPLLLDETHTIEEQTDRLMDGLHAVGLTAEHLELYPRDLSVYELQLLAVARALILRPRLVVFDEPVKLLNARQRGDMLMLINRLRADFGFSALITSSNLDLVRHVADRALLLDAGRIVDEGTPGALLETPRHAATRAMADARLPEVGIGVVAPVGR